MSSKKKDLEIIYSLQWNNKLTNGGDKAKNIIGVYDIPATTLNWEIFKSYLFKKDFTEEISATVSSIVSNIKPHSISQPTGYHKRKTNLDGSKRIRRVPPLSTSNIDDDFAKDILRTLKVDFKYERKLEKLEHKTKKIRDKKMALFTRSSGSEAGRSSSKSQGCSCESSVPQHDSLDDEIFQMDASPVNTQEIVPHMLGGEVYLHQWEVINTGKLPWTRQTALIFTWGSKALKPLDTIVPVPFLQSGEIGTISVRLQVPNNPGQYECYWHFHHKEHRFGQWLGCQIIVDEFDLKGNKSVLETSYQHQNESTPKSVNSFVKNSVLHMMQSVDEYAKMYVAAPDSGPSNAEEIANIHDEEIEGSNRNHGGLVRDLSASIENIKLQDPTDTNCSSDSDNRSIVSLSESTSSRAFSQGYVVVPMPECFKTDNAAASNEGLSSENVVPLHSSTPEIPKSTASDGDSAAGGAAVAMEKKTGPAAEQRGSFDGNNNSGDVEQTTAGSARKGDDACSTSSRRSDLVMVTLPDGGDKDGDEYAYVIVDGQNVPIPKKIIKSEYLQTVHSPKSTPENLSRFSSANSSVEIINNDVLPASQQETAPSDIDNVSIKVEREVNENAGHLDFVELSSHCSAAGSCYSDANATMEKNARLFVFPQDCPGYEIVYPVDELAQAAADSAYTWANSESNYAYTTPHFEASSVQFMPHPPMATPSNGVAASENNPFFAPAGSPEAVAARADPQPLNLSTGVPIHHQEAAQGAARDVAGGPITVGRDITEGFFTPTPDPSTRKDSPDRDFLTTERARRPTTNFLRSESLLQGATTAFNTAKSVINRMVPQEQPGKWVNGHWVSTNPATPREANLQALAEMGFWNRDLNATLLARYDDDLSRVVAELVQ